VGSHSLLADVAIILAAAFPLLFLGKKLRVPEVIAYLATGILIGPHALGWVRDTHSVELIAELGVALILFFVGLHLPFEKLKNLGKTTLVSGSLQMGLTVLLVVLVGMPFGADVRRTAFYGLLIALGSTAVVLPILSTRDEMGAPFARYAVLERRKALSSLTVEDAIDYRDFLLDPPDRWCGARHHQRWSPLWRPRSASTPGTPADPWRGSRHRPRCG